MHYIHPYDYPFFGTILHMSYLSMILQVEVCVCVGGGREGDWGGGWRIKEVVKKKKKNPGL